MQSSPRQYIPGVCNLGQAETRVRYITGITGLILSILLSLGLTLSESPKISRVIVFIPLFIGALGFLQAIANFCVAYGIMGIFNVTTSLKHYDTVEQAEFRKKDRQTAIKIIALSFLLAASGTAVIYVFPS